MSPSAGFNNGDRKSGTNGYHQARTRAPGQPLRRGDACLMCRAKKLKCSAQKPVCDQCVKRKDRCVYDGVRPASRVEKLQRKLAEMEDEELREAFEARRRESMDRFAFMVPPSQPMIPLTSSIGHDNGLPSVPNQWNFDLSTMPPSATGSGSSTPAMNGHGNTASPPLTGSSGRLTEMQDTPGTGWPWAPPQSKGFSPGTPHPHSIFPSNGHYNNNVPLQQGNVPWSMLGSSTDHSTFYGLPEDRKPTIQQLAYTVVGNQPDLGVGMSSVPNSSNPSPHLSGLSPTNIGLTNHSSQFTSGYEVTLQADEIRPVSGGMNNGEAHILAGHLPSVVKDVVDSVMEQKRALDERSVKACQISDHARDYLLNLFFYPVPPRPRCGSEVFTETQFRAKLTLPLNEQPHPCLLFSMYATATSHSYVPAIRRLAEPLFTIAMSQLDEAVRHTDRVIDAVNAGKNLSKWLYTKGRLLEGYQVSCRAVALCMACGLHQIPSSSLSLGKTHQSSRLDESGQSLLPPPKDQGELCERIHAFWAVWGNDRGGYIIHAWPSAIRDEQITTPLPRPAEDYHTSLVHVDPDVTLRDLYDLPHREKVKPFNSFYKYILVACHIVHRAMNLSSTTPEAAVSSYRSLGQSSTSRSHPLRKMHPVAYQEIMSTSLWLEDNMPQKWKVNRTETPMWTAPDVPVVALILKITRMHLHSTHDPEDREVALILAFECAALIKLWLDNLETNFEIQELSLQALSNESFLIAMHGLTSKAQMNGIDNISSDLTNGSSSEGDSSLIMINQGQDQNGFSTALDGPDIGSDLPGSFRNLNGMSGPYCLSPVLSVIKYLVHGQQILISLGKDNDASRCAIEVKELVNRLKNVGSNGNIPKEYIDKLDEIVIN
ncbi:hypothetical protein IAT40_005982 [Kwoniella sp. CBS 6097]